MRRAENLLTSLEGILSARVVTTPLGEVSEVHVLAQAGLQPKQLVRNIESALLAHLGLKVDHRKISIAQTADVKPIEALERDGGAEPVAPAGDAVRERLGGAGQALAPDHRASGDALAEGRTETAEEESGDTPRSRVEAAARAAVTVLDRLLGDSSLALEGAKMVEAFDREFVFMAVQGLGGRDSVLLTGTARDPGERGAGGGVRGDGRDEPVDGIAAAARRRAVAIRTNPSGGSKARQGDRVFKKDSGD